MPRTKRPVKQQENLAERIDILKKLDDLVLEQKNLLDRQAERECREVEVRFKLLLSTIPKTHLIKTLKQLEAEFNLNLASTAKKTTYSRPASHDDGYLTEGSQTSGSSKRGQYLCPPSARPPRRSRSADLRHTSMKPAPSHRSRSVYKTPMCNKNINAYPPITPKVCPETAMTLLRQPRQGEMVVSMSGSPVMVPTYNNMQRDEKANCNIMLEDGTMLSLQPKQLRQSQAFIPYSLMDSSVIRQLKILTANLESIVKNGENSKKK